VLRHSQLSFDAGQYQTDQVFYPSKDGTQVSMFLVHRKGMPLDGRNPTVLYGYGGFNVAISPSLAPRWSSGWKWRRVRGGQPARRSRIRRSLALAGARHNKQNVFDDFIAAAEWLIHNRYTSTPKLAIFGAATEACWWAPA